MDEKILALAALNKAGNSKGSSGNEEWVCILGDGYSTEVAASDPCAEIKAEGTTKITQELGARYKKLWVRLGSRESGICTSGNVKLSWGAGDSNWQHLQEQKGTNTWTDTWWIIEFYGAFIQVRTAAGNTIKPRVYNTQKFSSTNNLVLTTVASGATFNNFYAEIWGVKA